MSRFISIPAISKRVPLLVYVQGIREAKRHPDREFKHGLTTWWPVTGAEIVQQFRDGMHARISAGIPYCKRGLRHD